MLKSFSRDLGLTIFMILLGCGTSGRVTDRLVLKKGWHIRSSAEISASGGLLSSPDYKPKGWLPAAVPSTVLAALVENGVYPDPYYGLNLKSIPGYREGRWLSMPDGSPFRPTWWFRTVFEVPLSLEGKQVTLCFNGINYKASIWLNGYRIADSTEVIGMFRRFEFSVEKWIRFGERNGLAVEVSAPGKLPDIRYRTKQLEATTGWDDHNPQPPDLNMGLWQDVFLKVHGPVRIMHPHVTSDLDIPSLDRAHLSVSALLESSEDGPVTGTLSGTIEGISFEKEVTLAPGEKKEIRFSPDDYSQLNIENPRIWWPHPMGDQPLYTCRLEFRLKNRSVPSPVPSEDAAGQNEEGSRGTEIRKNPGHKGAFAAEGSRPGIQENAYTNEGAISDTVTVRFGIREATTYINSEGWRGYRVNGKNVLIRGGAWMTCDMLLRLDRERYEALIRYAREANLNMLRSEGFSIRETDTFYDLCDKYGVMVTQQIFGRSIPDEELAIENVKDMMLRIRNHPSLVHFLGHDETFPTPALDQAYRDLIAELTPERSYQPHSGAFEVEERFETGGTRTGTMELWTYAFPDHYYTHREDGAWGFAQSGGIGGIFAPYESLKRMMPETDIWPPENETFSFHTVLQGGRYFDALFQAMENRYGKCRSLEDFLRKGQALNYESARGMFEAYGRNKYDALGITTWKYDAAWPAALTWQYVDWYLNVGGAYYGAKKACEVLHIQYAYDDRSVWVVNGQTPYQDLTARALVFDADMKEVSRREAVLDIPADGKIRVFGPEIPEGISVLYFLKLVLEKSGETVSDNFYWLSTKPDIQGELGSQSLGGGWSGLKAAPVSYADFTMLENLPPYTLDGEGRITEEGGELEARVTVINPGTCLAFFVRLSVIGGDGNEVVPCYWQDNCIALLPGESRTLTARFAEENLEGGSASLRLEGWNAARKQIPLAR